MGYFIGATLALAVGVFGTRVGLDRDRAFYPTVMIVIAAYYILFALIGASSQALLIECAVAVPFIVAASVGFKKSQWLVVAALAAHGIQDFWHPDWVSNPGVPVWWPDFCVAYDVVAAGYLAGLILCRPLRAGNRTPPHPGDVAPASLDRALLAKVARAIAGAPAVTARE